MMMNVVYNLFVSSLAKPFGGQAALRRETSCIARGTGGVPPPGVLHTTNMHVLAACAVRSHKQITEAVRHFQHHEQGVRFTSLQLQKSQGKACAF
eukprot:8688231-Pyramimonas_sp.AAC.1